MEGGMAYLEQAQDTCLPLSLVHLFVLSDKLRPYLKSEALRYDKCYQFQQNKLPDQYVQEFTKKLNGEETVTSDIRFVNNEPQFTLENVIDLMQQNFPNAINPEGIIMLEDENEFHAVALVYKDGRYVIVDSNQPEDTDPDENYKIQGVALVDTIESQSPFETDEKVNEAFDRMNRDIVWSERPDPNQHLDTLNEIEDKKTKETRGEIISEATSYFRHYEKYHKDLKQMLNEGVIDREKFDKIRKENSNYFRAFKMKALKKLLLNNPDLPSSDDIDNDNYKKVYNFLNEEIRDPENQRAFVKALNTQYKLNSSEDNKKRKIDTTDPTDEGGPSQTKQKHTSDTGGLVDYRYRHNPYPYTIS